MREVESLVDEVIMDNLHLGAYDPNVSGLPLTILGPEQNIAKHIDREMVVKFVETHYTGPRMSLISSGGLSHTQVEDLAKKYFGDMSSVNNRPQMTYRYTGGVTSMWNAQMTTSHAAFAFPVCGASHADTIVLQVLQTLIGSYKRAGAELHMHQGLNRDETRRSAISPEIESIQGFYTPYEDTGLLGFYAVSWPLNPDEKSKSMDSVINLLMDDLIRLAFYEVPVTVLDEAKSAFKATLLMSLDSTTNSAEDLGRQMLHMGKRVPLPEVFTSIDAVTPQRVLEVAHKYFINTKPVMSCVGHPNTLPLYDEMATTAAKVSGIRPYKLQ